MLQTQELLARYREIGLRLRSPPPRRVLALPPPAPRAPRFNIVYTYERHIVPIIRPSNATTAQKIITAAVALSGISRPLLLGGGRTNNLTPYRHILQMTIREETGLSLSIIARYLGGRDHTSVLHAIRRGRELVDNHPQWRAFHQSIISAISSTPSYVLSIR